MFSQQVIFLLFVPVRLFDFILQEHLHNSKFFLEYLFSGHVSQALEFFVGSLSIAKCIVILVVPLLLMYTCHQVHGKHFGSPRGKYTPLEPGKIIINY